VEAESLLARLVAASLRHRGVVLAAALAVGLYGAWTARHAELDVLPDFAPPLVVVQTEAPGLAPDQVETLVTTPIESALGGMVGLESLRSESIQGLSVVTAQFSEATDVYRARQLLAESLADVATRLPAGVQPPRPSPLTSATMDVLKIGLTSRIRTPMELRTLADWVIRPRLLMVPGVARINIFGGEVRQIQVTIDAQRLRAHGLAMSDVVAAARAATAVRGAGFIETENQRLTIEATARIEAARELAATTVGSFAGAPVRLADVATVSEGPAPRFGDALVQGESGVLLTLSSAYGTNTMEVTRGLEDALAELADTFAREDVTVYPRLHRPASFVEAALGNLGEALLLGALLVVVVLLTFLHNPRAALVSLTAIPLSLLGAVIVLQRCGVTLNTMSIGGLAIAIGEVVDDAIIDVENILRRLRDNARCESPRDALRVVLGASLEVRQAVVFATLAVVLVFLPLLALGGLQGRFFAPLALSYLLAVSASLLVALTVTPALALVLLGGQPPAAVEPRLQRFVRAAYRRILLFVERHIRLIGALIAIATVAVLTGLPFVGGEFLPDFKEHHLVVQVSMAPGTSLPAMRRLGRRLSRRLLEHPLVVSVEQQIGRAERGEDTWAPNRSEFHVELRAGPGADDERAMADIRALLEGEPGIRSEVLTFLGDRISETLTGETADVVFNVFGADLDVLDAVAARVAATVTKIPGAVDVASSEVSFAPSVSVRLRPEALQRYGYRPDEVLDQVQGAFAALPVGQVYRGQVPLDVVAQLEATQRADPASVGMLPIRSSMGVTLPLSELASVDVVETRDTVRHEGGRRRQTITCNVVGSDVSSFVDAARESISREVALPDGVQLTIGGTAQARAEAARDLSMRASLGFFAVVVLLAMVAGNGRNLLLLLANLPMALAGGAAALVIAPGGLSLGALVGFVTLFGITTRNTIMLLSHYRHLIEVEGMRWNTETALRGAADRLIPILMTALVTGLGLLPVALAAKEAGGEIEGPMAIVILGGLISSTLLNLLLFPSLAMHYGRLDRDGALAARL
jgi:CzcA family heavy metal efflux pump